MLAGEQSGDDPEADWRGELGQAVGVEGNAGLEESKQRQDQKRLQRVQHVLERDSGGAHVVGGEIELVQRLSLRFVVHRALARQRATLELQQLLPGSTQELRRLDASLHRHEHRHQNARNGGVDAGCKHARPRSEGQRHVDPRLADAPAARNENEKQEDARAAERQDRDLLRVEEGDHQHGDQVVGDRQRGEEDLEPDRDALAEHGQNAEREGDVCRHGNAPAARPVGCRVEHQKEKGRHDCATDGCTDWKNGLPRRGELAHDDLALDLETDDEEEDRHQAVVDPVAERHLERALAPGHSNVGVDELEVSVGPWRVGPDQRQNGARQQNDAARNFRMEKSLKRVPRVAVRSAGCSHSATSGLAATLAGGHHSIAGCGVLDETRLGTRSGSAVGLVPRQVSRLARVEPFVIVVRPDGARPSTCMVRHQAQAQAQAQAQDRTH